jgi:hypothetical protein
LSNHHGQKEQIIKYYSQIPCYALHSKFCDHVLRVTEGPGSFSTFWQMIAYANIYYSTITMLAVVQNIFGSL